MYVCKKFLAFYGFQRFIFMFTRVRLWTNPNPDEYITRPYVVSLKRSLRLPNTPRKHVYK